ncbi:MAG TPA: hypothetical protein VKB46_24210 [Pyrinomonadaceae bacterium]|nr:hypothetical protein [Pyrinomonadaceae bacterium]
MRKIICAFVVLLTCQVVGLTQEHSQDRELWFKYSSAEGRYMVLMPEAPKLSSQETTGGDGSKLTQFLASLTKPNSVYIAAYFDRAATSTFSLDKARDGMLEKVNGTLVSQNPISIGGYSGLEFRAFARTAAGDEFVVRARVFDVDSRVYVLQYIVSRAAESPAAVKEGEKFLNSFTLTGN